MTGLPYKPGDYWSQDPRIWHTRIPPKDKPVNPPQPQPKQPTKE